MCFAWDIPGEATAVGAAAPRARAADGPASSPSRPAFGLRCARLATAGQGDAGPAERSDPSPVEGPGAQGSSRKSTQVLKFG